MDKKMNLKKQPGEICEKGSVSDADTDTEALADRLKATSLTDPHTEKL